MNEPLLDVPRCPVCKTPTEAGSKYTPWCSRGCHARGKRQQPDVDVIARRMLYMQDGEVQRLSAELDSCLAAAQRRSLSDLERDLKEALLQEEVEILRQYGNKDCTRQANAEIGRRRREGRTLDDNGAEMVITAERRLALAKLA